MIVTGCKVLILNGMLDETVRYPRTSGIWLTPVRSGIIRLGVSGTTPTSSFSKRIEMAKHNGGDNKVQSSLIVECWLLNWPPLFDGRLHKLRL